MCRCSEGEKEIVWCVLVCVCVWWGGGCGGVCVRERDPSVFSCEVIRLEHSYVRVGPVCVMRVFTQLQCAGTRRTAAKYLYSLAMD